MITITEQVSIDENECEIDGVDYVAVSGFDRVCVGCVAHHKDDKFCQDLGECRAWVRNDCKTKIWVKK